MSRTITIVAKGPTAIHAQKWIDACPGSDVAIINEAGLLLRKQQPIRFAFFCHARFGEPMRPLWSRVDCFVSPSKLIGSEELPADFPAHKRLRYACNSCMADNLRFRLSTGGVAHHHTVAAAMSWLAKIGYKRIRIIGTGGGGREYAPGLVGKPKLPDDMSVWPRVERTLAGLLRELYNTKTEWYNASNHPRKNK
jgi:hypothetical protein